MWLSLSELVKLWLDTSCLEKCGNWRQVLSDKLMSNSRIQSYILDLDQKGECDTVA